MIILPQIKELQRGNLTDLNGIGGTLPAGNYKNITGTFSSVGSDCTSVIALNFNASITNTGAAVTSPYTYSYPSSWPTITSNTYTSIPTVTLNSGSPGTAGGIGGGGGGTAGGGATAGGNGGNGGAGGPGLAGRQWNEQTLPSNNTVYGAAGSGGNGGTGAAGSPSINGVNGTNGANSVSINLINKLYSWGSNGSAGTGGVLGDNTVTSRCSPMPICSSLNFTCVVTQPDLKRTYALTTDFKLYTWGRNDSGSLANGTNSSTCSPVIVCPSCSFNVICHAYANSFVIGTDNKLYSVGSNNLGQLGTGDLINRCVLHNICSACNFKNIINNGYSTNFAIGTDDKLYAWGCNDVGQLGNGNTINQCSLVAICPSCTFSCISFNNCNAVALTTTNKLFLWGLNNRGQIGNGNTTNQSSPVAVCSACSFNSFNNSYYFCICSTPNGLGGFFFTYFCYNYIHAIGIDCKLYAWGDNSVGQLGNGNLINQCLPVNICPTCSFISVYSSSATTFAIDTNCKLYAWGCNNFGQLGNGNTINQCLPVNICPTCSFTCVFQNFDATATYAIDTNCRLFSWGCNFWGQLGNGNLTNQCLPVNICPSCNFKCVFGSYNNYTMYAVDINDKLYAWGVNDVGQVGNNCIVSCQCNPFQVRGDLFFNKFTVSNNHIHAITTSGGNGGRGGNTYTLTAPAGGIGGAGGGGGGGGQSIFCRYSYPSYIAQNLDTLPTPNITFHGNGGRGASGNITGATAGGTGGIPATAWPACTSRSGTGGIAGTASPIADPLAGGNGGCIAIAGPTSAPASGTPGDLGSPADTFTFGGGGTAGGNSPAATIATGTNSGPTGSAGGTGGTGTFPSAGGGGGGRGGTGGNGSIQALGANGGAGGAGSVGGSGGSAGRSLGLMVYNSVCGCILSFGSYGSNALSGSPGSLGQTLTHSNGTSYTGACGGNGGIGGSGGQGSAGRVLLVGRYTQFLCNNSFCANGIPTGENGNNGTGDKLYTWGDNTCGRVGNGSITNVCTPVTICSASDFILSNMINNSCSTLVLNTSDKLFAWGDNSAGQLGNGNTTPQCLPVAICSACNFRCAISYRFPLNGTANTAFSSHAIGIDGKLYTWGSNNSAQVGNGTLTNQCSPFNVCPSCSFICVVTEGCSTYSLTTNYKIFSWGCNNCGQLGNGNTTNQCLPISVCSNCTFNCLYVYNSTNTSGTSIYALGTDCRLYSWGANEVGQLGNGNITAQCLPINICSSCTFRSITSNRKSVLALTTNCKLFAWGCNVCGELGTGNTTNQCLPVAICSACDFNCVIIDGASNSTSYALTTDGRLFAWGNNASGQVGNGGIVTQCLPVAICSTCTFNTIVTDGSTAFALTTDCRLFAWGSNTVGQVGNGNITNQCLPVAICSNCFFNCVFYRPNSVYAIGIDGRLYAWGNNSSGELGNGNTTNQCLPVNICSNLFFSAVCAPMPLGVIAIANSGTGAGGTGGTWSSFATLSCGTPGTAGIRGNGGAAGTITSATPGESSVYYLI